MVYYTCSKSKNVRLLKKHDVEQGERALVAIIRFAADPAVIVVKGSYTLTGVTCRVLG
jgi:hypothetical protein